MYIKKYFYVAQEMFMFMVHISQYTLSRGYRLLSLDSVDGEK
jgi:hypothetical protein